MTDPQDLIDICVNTIDRVYEYKYGEDELTTEERLDALSHDPKLCSNTLYICLRNLQEIYLELNDSTVLEDNILKEARLCVAAVSVLVPKIAKMILSLLGKKVEHVTCLYKDIKPICLGFEFLVIESGRVVVGTITSVTRHKVFYRSFDSVKDKELPLNSKLLLLKLT